MHVIELKHNSAGDGDDIVDVQIFVGKFNHRSVNISTLYTTICFC